MVRVVGVDVDDFWMYLTVDGYQLSISTLFTVVYDPSPWHQISPIPGTSNLINVEMSIGRTPPVHPHWGQFIECNLVEPFSRLPGFNNS